MYYCLFFIMAIVMAIINKFNLEKVKSGIFSAIIPLFLIAFFYSCHNFFFPAMLNAEKIGLPTGYDALFLWFYLYPLLDLALFSMLLGGNYFLPPEIKLFTEILHFQLVGYGVGMILLVGYTEVEFYYILGYFIFRNIFVNWVLWKFEKTLNISPCLIGWGLIYYVSFLLNFVPIIGIGRLTISRGFQNAQWSKTPTLLYSTPNTNYANNIYTTFQSPNISFQSNVFWLSGIIIFLGLAVTQQYPRRKPEWKDFFYYLLGIYLFYLGISSALHIGELTSISL